MNWLSDSIGLLVCPETNLPLKLCSLDEAETHIGDRLVPLRQAQGEEAERAPPFGPTPQVLLREDNATQAYPVVDGFPILLVPEMLGPDTQRRQFDLTDPKYDEAYSEMKHYNGVATREASRIEQSDSFLKIIGPILKATNNEKASFPKPKEVWLDMVYDCAAQSDAYNHLAPIEGKRIMQLGGRGEHAVKFLLGGAGEAWVSTPMLGEAKLAMSLAEASGVAERLRCTVAVAEQMPFADSVFDGIYSGSCVHHMVTEVAFPEAARILKDGGAFASVDPWRTPFYQMGITVFGKREAVHCRPLTKQRIAPFSNAFTDSKVMQHGSLTRHLLLALNKLGLSSSLRTVWNLNSIDDRLCSWLPGFRSKMGSSIALLGKKK